MLPVFTQSNQGLNHVLIENYSKPKCVGAFGSFRAAFATHII